MKKILYFMLQGCPYCRQADNVLEELYAQQPEYRQVPVERVDEQREKARANAYDYWYVPCMWVGDQKIYEATPGETREQARQNILRALHAAMEEETLL
ncbi:MAG TPA: glutaredoxin [Candidatus Aphodomonas merdavium]|nr:glutaredoxin [Candidatus Aphodomonas merdavium]